MAKIVRVYDFIVVLVDSFFLVICVLCFVYVTYVAFPSEPYCAVCTVCCVWMMDVLYVRMNVKKWHPILYVRTPRSERPVMAVARGEGASDISSQGREAFAAGCSASWRHCLHFLDPPLRGRKHD